MTILPLVLLVALNPTDWSVDPAGSGDFTTLQGALAAPQVLDGDRLWIAPGFYGDVLVNKSVDLMALPGQRFQTGHLTISQAQGLTVHGLTAQSLSLSGCSGPIDLLGIVVGEEGYYSWMPPGVPLVIGGVEISACDQVLIAGSVLRATQQCYDYANDPGICLSAVNSRIAISGSTLLGGDDLGQIYSECSTHYPTPPTISLVQSELTLSSVTVNGGLSGYPSSVAYGSGVALAMNASVLDARGTGLELWTAGHPGSEVIIGSGQGSFSNIQLSPPGLPGWLTTPDQPLPLLRAPALAAAGSSYTVELFAPAGMPAAVALSAFPALNLTAFPGLGALWLDPSAPFALYLEIGQGSTQPAAQTFQISTTPALLGLPIRLQAYLPPCPTPACPWASQGSLTPPLAALIR